MKRKLPASAAKSMANAKRGLRKAEPRRKSLNKTLDTWLARRKSRDPNVRGNAAVAFGMLGGEKARAALIEMLKDRNPDVKKEVVWGLGRFQDMRDRPALGRMLEDSDSRVGRLLLRLWRGQEHLAGLGKAWKLKK